MNVATDFVLAKQDGWGVIWFFVRNGVWTTNLEEAKTFATREKAEKRLNSRVWPNVKYLTKEEAAYWLRE